MTSHQIYEQNRQLRGGWVFEEGRMIVGSAGNSSARNEDWVSQVSLVVRPFLPVLSTSLVFKQSYAAGAFLAGLYAASDSQLQSTYQRLCSGFKAAASFVPFVGPAVQLFDGIIHFSSSKEENQDMVLGILGLMADVVFWGLSKNIIRIFPGLMVSSEQGLDRARNGFCSRNLFDLDGFRNAVGTVLKKYSVATPSHLDTMSNDSLSVLLVELNAVYARYANHQYSTALNHSSSDLFAEKFGLLRNLITKIEDILSPQ